MAFEPTEEHKAVVYGLKEQIFQAMNELGEMDTGLDRFLNLGQSGALIVDDSDPAVVIERAKGEFATGLVKVKAKIAEMPVYEAA